MKDVLGRDELITVDEALQRLLSLPLKTTETESIGIGELAYKRILSRDITSHEDLPGFDRSTMDGYAVNSADTFGATESAPAYLELTGEVTMGYRPGFSLNRGSAAQIPTGGMLPEGADSVVMYEHTNRVGDDTVEILKSVAPGENIIRRDEDVKKEEVILRRGHRLRPQDIGALAGLGVSKIHVFKEPAVSLISTGNEIVPPEVTPSPGQVRDINSFNLFGLIRENGGIPVKKGIISDEIEKLRAVVSKSLRESDMVIITGGSSVGTRDYAAKIIAEFGSPGILFHGVAIKPGKPIIGALVKGIPVFGLPGHPAAVTVSFKIFVKPVLSRLSGEAPRAELADIKKVKAVFSRNLSSSIGREEHIRVYLEHVNGTLRAVPILGKSGLIKTLVKSDGLVKIPFEKNGLYEGEEVEVLVFS